MLKVDLDRTSVSFGEILDSVKGTPGALDFGASPTLFTASDDRQLLAVPQRNGSFFAFDTETMTEHWSAALVPQAAIRALGDVSSPATDGERIFASVNPGLAFGLDGDTGTTQWVALTADVARYQSMSVANGVVYTIDAKGFLLGFDAATGLGVLAAPLANASTGANLTVTLGAGVSIARNTVYTAVGNSTGSTGFIIAFKPLL